MNKKIIVTSLMLISANSWAAINAIIDKTIVEQGQPVNLTITVTSIGASPDLSPLQKDFQIVGKSTSSQTSIVNGSVSSQTNISLSLIPNHSGKVVIPSIKIDKDVTKPITIEVTKNSNAKTANLPDKAIFLKTSIDKTSSYVGVPVILSVKLYLSLNLGNLTLSPFQIDGAHYDKLNDPSQYQSEANGRPYMVVEQKFLVTPDKVGKIIIPTIQLNGAIASNNPAGYRLAAGQAFSLNSEPISLNVKDIPNNIDASEWFPAKNVVVNEIWSEKNITATAGDPITRTVTINADGVSATSIPEFNFTKIENANIYPDKTISDTKNTNTGVNSSKIFKIVYIPINNGEVKFPEVKIKWFDIDSNQEKTAILPAKVFHITGAIEHKKTDKIDTKNNISQTQNDAKSNLWQYISYVIGFLWLATMVIFFILRKNKNLKKAKDLNESDNTKSEIITKPNKISTKNKDLDLDVAKACTNKDIYKLNLALIKWANIQFKTTIHNINQIKPLASDHNLNTLIDELLAALYNDKKFDKFNEINILINNISHAKKKKMAKNSLPEIYPFDIK
ncbi:MAG: BatD family protein [Burkholderiales bacterium]|nr:BatD family protein [Burkholderiales bacterium]